MFKRVICLVSLILSTVFSVSAGDISINNLVPASLMGQSDLFVIVTNTGGVAITRNITLANLENSFLIPWSQIGSVPANLYQWANLLTNTPNINIGGSAVTATYAVQATNVVNNLASATNYVLQYFVYPAQGMASDLQFGGTNTYTVDTSQVQLGDARYYLRGNAPAPVNPANATNNLPGWNATLPVPAQMHFGDPDYYQNAYAGYLYLPFESHVASDNDALGSNTNYVLLFGTMAGQAYCGGQFYFSISVSNYQNEISGVAIDGKYSNGVAMFTSDWANTSATNEIFVFALNNLSNATFIKALTLSQPIQNIQGIVFNNGLLYASGDYDKKIFCIDPTNGTVLSILVPNLAAGKEFEGLDNAYGMLALDIPDYTLGGGILFYNWFGLPSVDANENSLLKMTGQLANTGGKIGLDQMPYPIVMSGDSSAGVEDMQGLRNIYATYFRGSGYYLTQLPPSVVTNNGPANFGANTITGNGSGLTFTNSLTTQIAAYYTTNGIPSLATIRALGIGTNATFTYCSNNPAAPANAPTNWTDWYDASGAIHLSGHTP